VIFYGGVVLIRLLGEGGFGRVYLAHDEQLQRLVPIKVPHRKLTARQRLGVDG
jgi:eukaryotic-like serine/threonine-protein kinase